MESASLEKRPRVASRIVGILDGAARNEKVADVRIGLGYTAVMLASGQVGVAFTFHQDAMGGCSVFDGLRPLTQRPASDLLALLESSDRIEAGVGLACANALANVAAARHIDGDVLDHLVLRPTDCVGMVGRFGPLLRPLRERCRSLVVLDQGTQRMGETRSEDDVREVLSRSQIALITATSLVNHTIDDLLAATNRCREVVILGASTPMLPEAFRSSSVTLVSGVVVKDAQAVLTTISEGGGMRQFSSSVRKVCQRVSNHEPC